MMGLFFFSFFFLCYPRPLYPVPLPRSACLLGAPFVKPQLASLLSLKFPPIPPVLPPKHEVPISAATYLPLSLGLGLEVGLGLGLGLGLLLASSSSYPGLGLGSSLACLAADVLAPVLLPVDDHDAAAAPLLVPLLPAPAAVPVPPSRLERALGPQGAHGRLGPELGRRRPRDRVADHPAACLPCLAAAAAAAASRRG